MNVNMTEDEPHPVAKKRVAVFLSGGGSNFQALADAAQDKDFPANICLVISNKADAGGLKRAQAMGIKTAVFPTKDYADRRAQEEAMLAVLSVADIDIVCLAGYMRLFTDHFISQWQGRMINIHPSLLPLFPGLHTHQRALDAGMRIHGCSVHFVTLGTDEGPIIGQAAVPVNPKDDADSLAARVLKVEHLLYPKALALFASGGVYMDTQERACFTAQNGTNKGASLISI